MKTSEEQDAVMLATAQEDAHTTYSLFGNNCADLCRNVLKAGGLETGQRQHILGITMPVLDFQEIAAQNPSGENINFVLEGGTPESVSKGVKENMVKPTDKQRSKNAFIFSQLTDKSGKIKVDEGVYKLDKDLNLVKQ
jgi:hypothetical protein